MIYSIGVDQEFHHRRQFKILGSRRVNTISSRSRSSKESSFLSLYFLQSVDQFGAVDQQQQGKRSYLPKDVIAGAKKKRDSLLLVLVVRSDREKK